MVKPFVLQKIDELQEDVDLLKKQVAHLMASKEPGKNSLGQPDNPGKPGKPDHQDN